MTFPTPNRSNHVPNFSKSADNDQLDIGWFQGTLSDGREFRAECWATDQLTMLTFFLSTLGLENATAEDFVELLQREALIEFVGSQHYVAPAKMLDDVGNEMWSINVIVGDEDETFVRDSLDLKPYR